MGGVEYGRPLATGWTGTLGVNWQRAKCLDEHGKALTQVTLHYSAQEGMQRSFPRLLFHIVGCWMGPRPKKNSLHV